MYTPAWAQTMAQLALEPRRTSLSSVKQVGVPASWRFDETVFVEPAALCPAPSGGQGAAVPLESGAPTLQSPPELCQAWRRQKLLFSFVLTADPSPGEGLPGTKLLRD